MLEKALKGSNLYWGWIIFLLVIIGIGGALQQTGSSKHIAASINRKLIDQPAQSLLESMQIIVMSES